MTSHTTRQFREAYQCLPAEVRAGARQAFALWQQDPHHGSLQFKQVHPKQPIYSARVGLDWRALGVRKGDVVIWFWIGSHAEYDTLISTL